MKQKIIRDDIALDDIRSFLVGTKRSGDKIGIIELMLHFNYPPQKINRIMNRLEKEGLVKEEEW